MKHQPLDSEDFGISLDGIPGIVICVLLSTASFWAYFNGYVVAFKRLTLWEYSFLFLWILFIIGAIYLAYDYYQDKKSDKKD